MAHYTINHSCGHSSVAQLFGKTGKRKYVIGKMEQDDCPDCQAQALAVSNAKKASENKQNNLPDLDGTPKQVAWAESIRNQIIADLTAKINASSRPDLQDKAFAALELLKKQDLASWWIDRRKEDCGAILKGFMVAVLVAPAEEPKAEYVVVHVKMTKADIMRRAWVIARGIVAMHGGCVKSALSMALKQAWAEFRAQ